MLLRHHRSKARRDCGDAPGGRGPIIARRHCRKRSEWNHHRLEPGRQTHLWLQSKRDHRQIDPDPYSERSNKGRNGNSEQDSPRPVNRPLRDSAPLQRRPTDRRFAHHFAGEGSEGRDCRCFKNCARYHETKTNRATFGRANAPAGSFQRRDSRTRRTGPHHLLERRRVRTVRLFARGGVRQSDTHTAAHRPFTGAHRYSQKTRAL